MNISPTHSVAYHANTQVAVNQKTENKEVAQKVETTASISVKLNKPTSDEIEQKAQALRINAIEILKNYTADRKEAITNLSNSLRLFEKYQAKHGNGFDIYMQEGVIKVSSNTMSKDKKTQLETEINQDTQLVSAFSKLHDATLNIYNTQVKLRNLNYSYKDKKIHINYPEDDTLRQKKDIEGKLKLIRAGKKFIEQSPDGVQNLKTSLLNKVEKATAFSQAHTANVSKIAAQCDEYKKEQFMYAYHSAVVEFDNVTHDIARSLGVESVTIRSMNINPAISIYSSLYGAISADRPKPELEKAIKQAESLPKPNPADLEPNPEDFKGVRLYVSGSEEDFFNGWTEKAIKKYEYYIEESARVTFTANDVSDSLFNAMEHFDEVLGNELLKGRYLYLNKDDIDVKLQDNKLIVVGDNIKEKDKIELAKVLTEDAHIKDALNDIFTYLRDTYNAYHLPGSQNRKSLDSFTHHSFKEVIEKLKDTSHLDVKRFHIKEIFSTALFFIDVTNHNNHIENWL